VSIFLRVRILARGEKLCYEKCPDWLWDTIGFLFNEQRGCQSDVKRAEPEVKHSPASIAEDEKEWSCTPTVPILFQDVVRNNLCRCYSRDSESDKFGSGISGLE
jgi:hypothetical protein